MEPLKWFDRKSEFLSIRIDNDWSIKENIGHLTDLEFLWQLRLSDIISSREYMSPTDLANNKTELAGHNSKSTEDLLNDFSLTRNQTLAMLENLEEEIIFKSSLHPRLKTPMRTMDLFLFVAEHDDHHLARITALEKRLRNSG